MSRQGIIKKVSSVTARFAGIAATVCAAIAASAVMASAGGYHFTDLGTLPGYTNSVAYSINNWGQVVGDAVSADGTAFHAALFNDGKVTDLGTLPGYVYSQAYAINNWGQAVGYAITADGTAYQAALFGNGKVTDLGTLRGFTYSQADGINDWGQAVGYAVSTDGTAYQAALFSNGNVTDLGGLRGYANSLASSINNWGQAVGMAFTADYTTFHAVLFSNGKVTDLNSLVDSAISGYLYSADSINDAGQIVGYISIKGQSHAFLLTPDFEQSEINMQSPPDSYGNTNPYRCGPTVRDGRWWGFCGEGGNNGN